MSRLTAFVLCLSLTLVALAVVATPAPVRAAYVKLAYDASLQELPDDSAYSVTMLPAGVVVTITGDPVERYYPVTAGGKSGWIHGDALALDAVASSAPIEPVAATPEPDAAGAVAPAIEEPLPVEPAVEEVATLEPVAGATPVAEPVLQDPAPAEPMLEEPVPIAPEDQSMVGAEVPAAPVAPAANLDPNAPPVAVPDAGPVGPAAVAVEAPIFAGPGPEFGTLGMASAGAMVEQTGHAVGGYVTVRYVGVTGWVALDHLGLPPAPGSS